MNAARPLVITAAAISTTLMLTAAPSPAQANLACKPLVHGKGVSIRRSYAGSVAVTAWTTRVLNRHGRAYAAYRNAANRSNDCTRVGTKWRCVARGRPCRSATGSPGVIRGRSPFEPIRRSPRQLNIRP